jgi:phospholipase/lecithinase/hemolysin
MAYSGMYVFGDSLVDAGNALKLAKFYGTLTFSDLPEGAPSAALGYFDGRFTNGYTFADLISNKTIGLVTKPVFPFGYDDPWIGIPIDPFAGDPSGNNLNFAYGGSQIRQGDEVVPDLDGQTDAFKDAVDNHADPNALYMVTIGGNDVRSLAPAGSNPASVADAHAALDAAADKLLHELGQLVDIGVHNLLIVGVPDVGLIPKYDADGSLGLNPTEQARADAATEYSIYLDNLIRTQVVPALEAMGADVTYVPIAGSPYADSSGRVIEPGFEAILPEIAALHGLTANQLSDNLLQYQNLVFFDQVHPTAQADALIGAYMYAQLNGAPWVEKMPLAGADVDYHVTATIGAAGEVDSTSITLVAGTTYTFQMLGVSSLGIAGSVGDTRLSLVNASGGVVASDDDSGMGFDASLTFTVATSGVYSLKASAVGMLTGAYALDAAVVTGAAMQANTYTVSSASTVVLEAVGGGQDVVKTSVSYALASGSEIEVLRTTNDKGKTAINLTGNDFSQTLVGNAGSNVLEGKGGADVLSGLAGKDTFVLSKDAVTNPGAGHIDSITDYAAGEIVDITQILSVAAGTNVLSSGYLRVTTSGLIQVDMNGGGSDWVTLSTVNGTGAVTIKYLSGGNAATLSVGRVADASSAAASDASVSFVDSSAGHLHPLDHFADLAALHEHVSPDALFV